MDAPQYTKANLLKFIDTVARQGSVNANTAAGWKAACARILEDYTDGSDVRTLDVATAVRRYHNKHPGKLSSKTLNQYEKRLGIVLKQFASYNENPTGYKTYGRRQTKTTDEAGGAQRKKVKRPLADSPSKAGVPQTLARLVSAVAGLTLDFPIRPDFTAQVIVPRDMKAAEARRFAHYIMTLAHDYTPPKETSF